MEDLLPAACLERYEIDRLLGEGGYGRVYLARQRALQRSCVLKILAKSRVQSAQTVERFIQEARLTASLIHPHIVTVLDFGHDEGIPWIVYEHIPGGSLADHTTVPSSSHATMVGIQVAAGLEAAHGAGILHRDLKASNVMLFSEQHLKVIDFGTAKSVRDEEIRTEAGVLVGTPAFMPPERIRCEDEDARSDLYSLGIMLYQQATGRMPFENLVQAAMLWAHLQTVPPEPCKVRDDIPAALSAVIMQCLAKAPADRPASAYELRKQLEAVAVLQGWSVHATGSLEGAPMPRAVAASGVRNAASPARGRPGSGRAVVSSASGRAPVSSVSMASPRPRPGALAVSFVLLICACMVYFVRRGVSPGAVPPPPGPSTAAASSPAASSGDLDSIFVEIQQLEASARSYFRDRYPKGGNYGNEALDFLRNWRSNVDNCFASYHQAATLKEHVEAVQAKGDAGVQGVLATFCSAALTFSSWVDLWVLYRLHVEFQKFYLKDFNAVSQITEAEARAFGKELTVSGIEDWKRSTGLEWGALLMRGFTQRVEPCLERIRREEVPGARVPMLVGALHLVARCAVEMTWLIQDEVGESAKDQGLRRTLARYQDEMSRVGRHLEEPAPGAPPSSAALLKLLGHVWSYGQTRLSEKSIEAQRQRCLEALEGYLAVARPEEATREWLRKFIARPHQ